MADTKLLVASRRFAEFLTSKGHAGAQHLAPEIIVQTYLHGARAGELRESFSGLEEVVQWAQRSPGETFFCASEVGGEILYDVNVAGFVGGGRWDIELDEAGRICKLHHRPFPLNEDKQKDSSWREAVRMTIEHETAEN